jgi:2,3-bisphosphoglycerate-independent phosphoglycerate mutase
MHNKTLLIILDGWGLGKGDGSDAIAAARTPVMHDLMRRWPHSTLTTFGPAVGLPEGQMGNSEVGHLNLGAGRVVYQDLERINRAISDGTLEQNAALRAAFAYCLEHHKPLHLLGLVSDGGVHSAQAHLVALCQAASKAGLEQVWIHAITDGRDTDPKSGLGYLTQLEEAIAQTPARIATVVGRYYAMDRDRRWERVKLAYDLYTRGAGRLVSSATEAIAAQYAEGITDEFLLPQVVSDGMAEPRALITPGDAVICFNFRTDRCREITQALTQQAFPEQGMHPMPLHYVTMTNYDDTFHQVNVMFGKDNLHETLGEVISQHGLTQARVAETEKYPHVTFFFSGGREIPFNGELRRMVHSPKVATYDLQPEMSAEGVTEAVLELLTGETPDFICVNYANPDMVGHTGVYAAIVRAIETVDHCLGRILDAAAKAGYSALVLADHGNADYAVNPDGSPNTAHSLNPVPFVVVDERVGALDGGCLADVAPTLLQLMGIAQPPAMTGRALAHWKA